MQRIVDSNAIISVSKTIYEYLEQLTTQKNTLKTDIDSISSVYSGEDSTTIVNKYLERISKIDSIITDYTTIGNFLKKIGEAYLTNLNDSKNKIAQLIGETVTTTGPTGSEGSTPTGGDTGTGGETGSQSEADKKLASYKKGVIKVGKGKKITVYNSKGKAFKTKLEHGAEVYVVEKGKKWTKLATKDKNGNIVYGYVKTKYISMK